MDLPTVTAYGRSDTGRVRSGNEDAVFIGRSLFAVADGMGGHRGGEVASATALEPLAALDGATFSTSDEAIAALTAAVLQANTDVSRRSNDDPALEGMGTTLTAVLVDGRAAHLVHVGDSRAYLARGDRFVQLTDDHTLVQALLDQGRITPDEVATHPHRSVITRAIGVASDVEVDGMQLTLRDGDRIVLCSDGLTGVVDDATIARTVREHTPDVAVTALVDAANEAGGPDNITVVILDVAGGSDPDATAAIPQVVRIRTDEVVDGEEDWASRYSSLGQTRASRTSGSLRSAAPRRSRERLLGGTFDRIALRLVIATVVSVLVLTGLVLGARVIVDRAYFVGVDGDEIVIFRGYDRQFGPVDLRRIHERPGVLLDDVQPAVRATFEAGRPAADLGDARRIVRNIPLRDATSGAVGG